jgi:hypothetical protein
MTRLASIALAALAALAVTPAARADLTFFDDDRAGWEAATSEFWTIDFVGLDHHMTIGETFANLGVHFVGDPDTVGYDEQLYPRDGVGIDANHSLHLVLDYAITEFAFDYTGPQYVSLFYEGERIATEWHGYVSHGGYDNFFGLVSTEPFDEIVLLEPSMWGSVNVDDLHFGLPIPAPGAISILTLAALGRSRRRLR